MVADGPPRDRTSIRELLLMRMLRPALAVALVASVTAAGAAGAATKPKVKPVCNLVTDAAGDANGFVVTDTGLPVPPSDDNLDIVSADVASNAKVITAVIRLKALGSDSTAPAGSTVYFNFSVNGAEQYLNADLDGKGGATYTFGDFTGASGGRTKIGDATGVLDAAKKEIRISAPVSGFKETIKPGTKLTDLNALAQRLFVVFTPSADSAEGSKVYAAGATSCVVPGK